MRPPAPARARRWVGWVACALLAASPGAGLAAAGAESPHPPPGPNGPRSGAPPALFADGWWQKVYGPVEAALGSRQRMMQLGAVGMVIALLIIWYRKP